MGIRILPILLAITVLFAPHGDDETTLLPVAEANHGVVVVVTDSANTGWCKPELGGPGQRTAACEKLRRDATEGFLAAAAPDVTLQWVGLPDGKLTVAAASATIDYYCAPLRDSWYVDWGNQPPTCDMWFAGAGPYEGYLHPDHLALRTAVQMHGGRLWDGSTYYDSKILQAVNDNYGWLLSASQYPLIGLQDKEN